MSCLCDNDIREHQEVFNILSPFDEEQLQPASYELTFDGSKILMARDIETHLGSLDCIYDVKNRGFLGMNPWIDVENPFCRYTLYPGKFYIASSKEVLDIPACLMARFEGKSTLGRAGLMVHITAGYVDPGFKGTLTLEIMNVAPWPILLEDGDKIGQLSFHKMSNVPSRIYGCANNHYQNQSGPTPPL